MADDDINTLTVVDNIEYSFLNQLFLRWTNCRDCAI